MVEIDDEEDSDGGADADADSGGPGAEPPEDPYLAAADAVTSALASVEDERLERALEQKKRELLRLQLEHKQGELSDLRSRLLEKKLHVAAAGAPAVAPPAAEAPPAAAAEAPPRPGASEAMQLSPGTIQLAAKVHAERLAEKKRLLQEMMAKRQAQQGNGAGLPPGATRGARA